jgi:hypothetical protein
MTDHPDESDKAEILNVDDPKSGGLSLVAAHDPSAPLRYKVAKTNTTSKTFDDERKKIFLSSLSEFPSVAMAAGVAGVSLTTLSKHRYKDADFASAWDIAIDIGFNVLESEAIRRAVMGVKEPIYYKGDVVGELTKYSDSLLMFLLKGRRRELYGDKAAEEAPDNTVTIRIIGGLPDA